VLLQPDKRADAEAECRIGLALMQALVNDDPSSLTIRNAIPYYLHALGDVLRSLGRMAEAKELYDRAIAQEEPPVVSNPTDPEYVIKLLAALWRRAMTLRDLGDPARAAADARRAVRLCAVLPPRFHIYLFELACSHAALAGLAEHAGSGVSAAEGNKAAAIAMQWLRKLIAVGYRNLNELRIESALDPLRNRDDFKKLMAELENNAPAQPEKK
jgi:tetratricopeptide (TPR) repeat protein